MATRTVCPIEVPERVSFRYTSILLKEDGTPIVAADLTTFTLTIYALDDNLTICNGVLGQDILNVDRGTVSNTGLFVLLLRPADNALVDATVAAERHVLLIQATYANGTGASRHEVEISIRNLAKVV